MYSTKNIDSILLSAALNENTRNKYTYFNNIEEIREILFNGQFSDAVEAYKQGHRLFRGDKSLLNYKGVYIIPGTRKSQDTSNIYNKLMSDILPSWKNYPKRNKSIICTTKQAMASIYAAGDNENAAFAIFPSNDTIIAVCPKADAWHSFSYLGKLTKIESINMFNERLKMLIVDLLNIPYKETENIFVSDNETILDIFNKMEKILKENDNIYKIVHGKRHDNTVDNLLKLLQVNIKAGRSLLSCFDILLSPKKNNFILANIFDVPSGNKEVWFSSECMTVRCDIIKQIL